MLSGIKALISTHCFALCCLFLYVMSNIFNIVNTLDQKTLLLFLVQRANC